MLQYSLESGAPKVCQLLLDLGADPDLEDMAHR